MKFQRNGHRWKKIEGGLWELQARIERWKAAHLLDVYEGVRDGELDPDLLKESLNKLGYYYDGEVVELDLVETRKGKAGILIRVTQVKFGIGETQ